METSEGLKVLLFFWDMIILWFIGTIVIGCMFAGLVMYRFFKFCNKEEPLRTLEPLVMETECKLGADSIFLTEKETEQLKKINKEKEDGY